MEVSWNRVPQNQLFFFFVNKTIKMDDFGGTRI